ncbi:hypothetical protein BGZ96_002043 [Linnemannia gamsii]|uniref:Uncharacterized protein n=1 Tax=Linnemannia gamsii TaxID=64522 RepID=A0ABQ7K8G8_9FUNG|nr:hypothetical protein BGZ96_002043 [Linnemannia gamsii]
MSCKEVVPGSQPYGVQPSESHELITHSRSNRLIFILGSNINLSKGSNPLPGPQLLKTIVYCSHSLQPLETHPEFLKATADPLAVSTSSFEHIHIHKMPLDRKYLESATAPENHIEMFFDRRIQVWGVRIAIGDRQF